MAVTTIIAAVGAVAGVAGTAAGLLRGTPEQVKATPRATRLEARERAAENDRLAQRRGTRANRRVGFGAGEAFTGPKTDLLGRSG